MTDISVIIPVRNGARFIEASVASVLAQEETAPGTMQVLVVDNGSTDGTVGLVRDRFGDTVALIVEPTPGPAHARNAGLAQASGRLIAFLDADDLWLPGKLARQRAALDADPALAMVFCRGEEFSDPPDVYPCRTTPYDMLSPPGLVARREVFDQAGPLPPLRAGEFIAWYGWTKELGYRAAVVPEVLVRRRVHGSNTTRDQGGRADYAEAMHWLLQRRRQRVATA